MKDLLAETRELLRRRNLTPKERQDLAQELQVTASWLLQLDRGLYSDPGVKKIQRLYEKLSGTALL